MDGRLCSKAEKMTVRLASHWPCVTNIVLNTVIKAHLPVLIIIIPAPDFLQKQVTYMAVGCLNVVKRPSFVTAPH